MPIDPCGPRVTAGVINAPIAEVRSVFSPADGFKKLGVAQCETDFRVGGLIRMHYSRQGALGDEGTIENEMLACEPQHLVASRIHRPPRGFPFSEATWQTTRSVATLTDLGAGRTHVRLAGN